MARVIGIDLGTTNSLRGAKRPVSSARVSALMPLRAHYELTHYLFFALHILAFL